MNLALEENSLWFSYKEKTWLSESEEAAVVHNVMRVLRSIRNLRTLAYASVPITTGKFFYERLLALGTHAEAQAREEAIGHNYGYGFSFVDDVAQRRSCPVLFPADLVPARQSWKQEHFQALWLSIISEKCSEMHMAEGWEYSSGGTEEFTHAMQLRLGIPRHPKLLFFNTKEALDHERERMRSIVVYDHEGAELTLVRGAESIERSVLWLEGHDFDAKRLRRCLDLLRWTQKMLDQKFYQ